MSKKTKKTLGLALGCGSWRGIAHLGVIKAFLEHQLPIDFIAGTSTGALIGGLYAAIQDIDLITSYFQQLKYRDIIKALSDPWAKSGLFKGNQAIKLLQKYLGQVNIEDLPIPFTAVAADLISAKTVRLKNGDLATAIRASGSVPLLFDPLKHENYLLTDGAMSEPVPVPTCRLMGADVVVAVNVLTQVFPTKNYSHHRNGDPKRLAVLRICYQAGVGRLAAVISQTADFVINPPIIEGRFGILDKFVNNTDLIEIGYQAALPVIKQVKKVIL